MNSLTREDVEVIKKIPPTDVQRGDWWHIRIQSDYYIISAVDLLTTGFAGMRSSETMAFAADADGEVTDWMDLAMVPSKDHWACIDDLLDTLDDIVDGEVVDEQPAITAAPVSTLDGGQ